MQPLASSKDSKPAQTNSKTHTLLVTYNPSSLPLTPRGAPHSVCVYVGVGYRHLLYVRGYVMGDRGSMLVHRWGGWVIVPKGKECMWVEFGSATSGCRAMGYRVVFPRIKIACEWNLGQPVTWLLYNFTHCPGAECPKALKGHMFVFVSVRTIKRHHHHLSIEFPRTKTSPLRA